MCQVNTGMEVACFDPLILPCADCGLLTGQFCDGGERDLRDYTVPVIGGLPCLAVDTVCRADGRHNELVNRYVLHRFVLHFFQFEIERTRVFRKVCLYLPRTVISCPCQRPPNETGSRLWRQPR